MQTTLLKFSDQQEIRPISPNNEDKFDQLAYEVENSELRKLLGDVFLYDIQQNTNTYSKLINGCEFTINDYKLKHRGLKFILAYLVYAKYVGQSNFTDTFAGYRQTSIGESELVSDGTLRRLQSENREVALDEFAIIKKYLNENYEDYPLWNDHHRKKVFTPRMKTLRKTRY